MFKKTFILCNILLIIVSCTPNKTEITVPDRPNNVPNSAFWQGGVDGGAWYMCKKLSIKFKYSCKVYNFNGELETKGLYELYLRNNIEAKPLKDFLKQSDLSNNDVKGSAGFQSDIYLYAQLELKLVN